MKKTRGRQKIEIKRIAKESDRTVTFSKRRSGIYKKVNELVTMTGSEVGFLVFSPAGKPFTYGDPSFEDLALRYLGQQQEPQLPLNQGMYRQARIEELLWTHNKLMELMEEEEKKVKVLRAKLARKPMNNWWNKGIKEVEVEELPDREDAYSKVFMMVENRRTEVIGLTNNINNYALGGASSSTISEPSQYQLMSMRSMFGSFGETINQ
ncbi:unnamed protein product [Linum tenue]|uniref:MADS-box domain-containing protein n=1 Tax=Linum tenue TaxID=586396 RepID=A0AAV0RS74_9ROSI|nr:unnamed protein product [Linum tenue]